MCGKIWEDTCGYGLDELGTFFRRQFLRAYYTNRAPLVFHLSARWLKMPINKKLFKMMPKQGRLNVEYVNVTYEQKDYPNLRGIMSFINKTIANNKDVYFVTAQQAVQWMRLLPRLEDDRPFNITELVHKELLDECGEYNFPPLGDNNAEQSKNKNTANRKKWDDVEDELDDNGGGGGGAEEANRDIDLQAYHMSQMEGVYKARMVSKTYEYDAKCDILKQDEPDYDKNEPIYLDDGLESDLIDNVYNHKEMLQWQSENLFVNDFIFYFLAALSILLVFIVCCDKKNKKKK